MKTLEQLSELLGGKLWSKGDIKRIYLDRGYNTKKMSTKTYVYQRQDGTFGVNCTIDCPSQHDNWISKEQDQIIESVEQRIEELLSDTVYVLVNNDGNTLDHSGKLCTLDKCVYFYTEKDARKEIDNCTYYDSFIELTRQAFEADYEESEIFEANLPLKVKLERGDKISFYKGNLEEIKLQLENEGLLDSLTATVHYDMSGNFSLRKEGDKSAIELLAEKANPVQIFEDAPTVIITIGKKYQHNKFGIGEVIKETEEVVEILFETAGVKQLLKKGTN